MDPILDKARAGQNVLEQIVNAIPGFSGYRERERRRDADRLQREYLATRLDDCKRSLNDAASAAARRGALDAINDIETARKRLDRVANRIRFADRGYSGFFDAVKIDESTLARVYSFDLGLLEGVDAVRTAAQASVAAADPRAAMGTLVASLDALDASLADREAMLAGVK